MILENKYLRKAIAKAGYVVLVISYQLDEKKNKVLYISPNADIIGMNTDLLKKGFKLAEDYIHPEDRGKVIKTIKEAIRARIDSYSQEMRIVGDNGMLHYVKADITVNDEGNDSVTAEYYIKDVTEKRKNKLASKGISKYKKLANGESKNIDLKARAEKDRLPFFMEEFARINGLYSAFVDYDGNTVFPPTGPATNLGNFYDLFETPAYREYYKFIREKVLGSEEGVLVNREEGGDGMIAAAPVKVNGELKGIWILGSYTVDETEILKEVYDLQWVLSDIMSDYLTKSAILEIESAKSKGAGQKLRSELEKQSIINGAMSKNNKNLSGRLYQVIEETIAEVGMHMDLDKIALYTYDEENPEDFVIKCFWDPSGRYPTEEFINDIPRRRFIIEESLKKEPDRFAVDSSNMTEEAKLILMRYELKASITFAIYLNDRFYGILLFGVSKNERKWTKEELRFTKSIALVIQNMIENAVGDNNIKNVNKHLIESYNNFNVGVFVRDAYSGEVLFSNEKMNEMMGKDFVGGNCKEILTDLHDRFDNITGMRKPFITRNKTTSWCSYIQSFDAIMDITEITIEWTDGRPASLIILRKAQSQDS